MLAEERKQRIIEELDRSGKVRVVALSQECNVSQETIRRDLDHLELLGKCRRVYGGAVTHLYEQGEPPYVKRSQLHSKEKVLIGSLAASLLQDGDTLCIDTGTTLLEMCRAIQGLHRLTIITNSLPAANQLTEMLNHKVFTGKVILLGGELNPEQQSVSGPFCERMLRSFHVDKAFISVGGVSSMAGVTDFDVNESIISQVMMEIARQVIVLADSSKIGVQAFCTIGPLDKVDVIVSNIQPAQSWSNVLEATGITWISAEPDMLVSRGKDEML